MKLIFLRPANDIPHFMRPVIANRFPIPVLDKIHVDWLMVYFHKV